MIFDGIEFGWIFSLLRFSGTICDKIFLLQIRHWIDEAGGDIDVIFKQKFTDQTLTSVAKDDPWYQAFMRAANKHELEIAPR